MAILIADTKLETETDAWYQFYVDKMSDIADLPTSQSTGASYKVKKLARPTALKWRLCMLWTERTSGGLCMLCARMWQMLC